MKQASSKVSFCYYRVITVLLQSPDRPGSKTHGPPSSRLRPDPVNMLQTQRPRPCSRATLWQRRGATAADGDVRWCFLINGGGQIEMVSVSAGLPLRPDRQRPALPLHRTSHPRTQRDTADTVGVQWLSQCRATAGGRLSCLLYSAIY